MYLSMGHPDRELLLRGAERVSSAGAARGRGPRAGRGPPGNQGARSSHTVSLDGRGRATREAEVGPRSRLRGPCQPKR